MRGYSRLKNRTRSGIIFLKESTHHPRRKEGKRNEESREDTPGNRVGAGFLIFLLVMPKRGGDFTFGSIPKWVKSRRHRNKKNTPGTRVGPGFRD